MLKYEDACGYVKANGLETIFAVCVRLSLPQCVNVWMQEACLRLNDLSIYEIMSSTGCVCYASYSST